MYTRIVLFILRFRLFPRLPVSSLTRGHPCKLCKPNFSVLWDSESVEREGLGIKLQADSGGDTLVWMRKMGMRPLTQPGRRECESAGRAGGGGISTCLKL